MPYKTLDSSTAAASQHHGTSLTSSEVTLSPHVQSTAENQDENLTTQSSLQTLTSDTNTTFFGPLIGFAVSGLIPFSLSAIYNWWKRPEPDHYRTEFRNRIANIESNITDMNNSMHTLVQTLVSIQDSLDNIERSLDNIEDSLDNIKGSLVAIEGSMQRVLQ